MIKKKKERAGGRSSVIEAAAITQPLWAQITFSCFIRNLRFAR